MIYFLLFYERGVADSGACDRVLCAGEAWCPTDGVLVCPGGGKVATAAGGAGRGSSFAEEEQSAEQRRREVSPAAKCVRSA